MFNSTGSLLRPLGYENHINTVGAVTENPFDRALHYYLNCLKPAWQTTNVRGRKITNFAGLSCHIVRPH
jgi:hypothetical protein